MNSQIEVFGTLVTLLKGIHLEPWVSVVVSGCLVAIVVTETLRRISSRTNIEAAKFLVSNTKQLYSRLDKAIQYAPGAEMVRKTTAPYFELVSSISFTTFGVMATIFFGLFIALAGGKLPWQQALLGCVYFCVSVVFARYNLAASTRAWHQIKKGKR